VGPAASLASRPAPLGPREIVERVAQQRIEYDQPIGKGLPRDWGWERRSGIFVSIL